MPCTFCGLPFDKAAGRSRSGEHAVPTWTLDVIPGSGGPITHARKASAHGPEVMVWKADSFDIVAKRVCTECNEGWMEALETEARDYLTTLIQGRGRPLYPEAQTVIAAWSAKTALALCLTTPEKPAPIEHYRHMAKTRRPPPNTRVVLAAFEAKRSIASSHTSQLDLRSERLSANGYASTFAIGHLVVQVFAFGGVEQEVPLERGAWAQAVQPIWPIEREVVRWPPLPILNDAQLDALSTAFETPS